MKKVLKIKKSIVEIDIIIAIMFISVVLYFAYVMATGVINKRYQTERKETATVIAENIMNRTLSKGVYSLINEPLEKDGFLPINTDLDAPNIPQDANGFEYQILVENSEVNGIINNNNLKKITITVKYSTKVTKYQSNTDSMEEDRYVTFTTFKSTENYSIQ